MSADKPEDTTAMPMYVFLANEITQEQLEMLGVYAQEHTLDDFAGQIKVAKEARVLLQSVPEAPEA